MIHKTDYLIIGLSAAGIHAAQTLRALDPNASITCIDPNRLPYNKCRLTSYNAGHKQLDELLLRNEQWFRDLRLDHYQNPITSINPEELWAQDSFGARFHYKKLLLAIGAQARKLNAHIDEVFTYNDIHDAKRLAHVLESCKPAKAVVIGAGLNGVELSQLLAHKDIEVTLLERSSNAITSTFSQDAQQWLKNSINKFARVHYNQEIVRIEKNAHSMLVHTLNHSFETDLVIACIGTKPATSWLPEAIQRDINGHIMVNNAQQTSVDTIFAAGDVCRNSSQNKASSLWPDAAKQGTHAAYCMVGQAHDAPTTTCGGDTKFPDFQILWRGIYQPDYQSIVEQTDTHYREIWRDSSQKLRGFVLIGTLIGAGELLEQFLRD